MNTSRLLEEEKEITNQIKKHVPLFSPFFDLDITVRDYSKSLEDFEVLSEHKERQEILKKVITNKVKKLFGPDYIKELNFGFDEKLAFNIADHHMVLSHPFLISANIVSSVPKLLQQQKPNPIIVLSSGDIPPNNYFSQNGFIFHSKRVPLFSVKEREYSSYYIPKRAFDFVARLKQIGRWNEFNPDEQTFLTKHQANIDSINFANCVDYSDQVTLIVRKMWQELFDEKSRKNLPDLLYLTQEELVSECLMDILQDNENIVSQSLFNPDFRSKVLENFRGIVTTWREVENKGTHFFWRKYPGEPRSVRMYFQDGFLVPQDERFQHLKVSLDKDTILDLLAKKEIYPSLFTIFAVLNFYLGTRPLTGFGSAVYLELMKKAWIKTLADDSWKREVELINSIKINGLVAGLVLAFARRDDQIKALYAHDIIYNSGLTYEYLQEVFGMSFKDVLRVGVADMYDYFSSKYIPADEKINKTISFDDLSKVVFGWVK